MKENKKELIEKNLQAFRDTGNENFKRRAQKLIDSTKREAHLVKREAKEMEGK